ncbi:MAG: hypothetical protein JRJ03_00420 [Deltaproteobacteria bacterium]|nr:hypothetical protein [Deltaproteobacteria bacterium]
MERQLEKLLEIRNQKGETLWSVWLTSNQARDIRERINEQENTGDQNKEAGQGSGFNNDSMTDAQKRYLFRLLADRGIEGEAAYRHLKEAFSVKSLSEITKYDASRAIDRMLNE